MVAKEEAEDVEAKAKRPRTDGVGVPPLFSQGGYSQASDGWWAHSGGEWLHNKSEMAYFHLPTGQIRVVLDESAELPAPNDANGKQEDDLGPLLRGRVRWFNEKKGFGFIEPIDDAAGVLDKDLFVHRNQIVTGAQNGEAEAECEAEVSASLQAEEVVTFHLGQTDDGRMCAVRVKVAEAEAVEEQDGDGDEGEGDGDASEASSVEIDLEEELKCGFHQDKAEGKEAIEDYLVEKLKLPINVLGETATCVFFGVFDGHGGPYCAEHVSTHLAKNILARLRDRARNVSDEIAVKTALLGGFKQTEHNYLQHAKKTDDSSGSTACTMTVFGPDEQMRLRLFMANCGDSRAVLCTGGTAQRLTEDHKPNLPAEKKRIEAADGGVVEVQGVWRCVLPQKKRLTSKIAGLAVSRSFGDKDFKGPDIVSAEPEITVHEVDWDADEFVILATDGIWDVLSDRDSVALVRQHLQSGKTEEKAAEALVKRAREKGSQDDCTALVVRFSWANKGQQTDAPELDEGQEQAADAPGTEMEVGEEEEEEMMDDDEEAEAEALARMARAMAANAGSVVGPDEDEEAASSSQAAPRKQEDRDIFAEGETEEQDEEAAGLKRWDKTNAAGALVSPLFEGLGPTREELAAGHGDGQGSVIGGLLKDVGADGADTAEAEKPPEAKEAVDADMDMFG